MKKHTVQANGDVLATAVEKRMLELGMFPILNDPFLYENIIYFAYIVKNIIYVKHDKLGSIRIWLISSPLFRVKDIYIL